MVSFDSLGIKLGRTSVLSKGSQTFDELFGVRAKLYKQLERGSFLDSDSTILLASPSAIKKEPISSVGRVEYVAKELMIKTIEANNDVKSKKDGEDVVLTHL